MAEGGGGGAGEELGVWRLQWPDCNQRRWHWCRSHRPQRTQRGSLKKGQTCEAKLRFKIPESRCWGSVAFWAQRGRPVFALAGWEEEVIYSSAEKCNKLTSTDQKSLMACCFRFFLLTSLSAPDAHRGQLNLLDQLLWLYTQRWNPPIHWLWMCCLFCVSHSVLLFDDDISSAGHSVNTLQVVKKKKCVS